MAKTEKKGPGAEKPPARNDKPVPEGIVEATMLGEVPGGTTAEELARRGTASAASFGRGPRAGRRRLVRGFLDAHPARREELEGEVGKAWEEAEAEPARFLRATAETRSRVIAEAELDLARREAPRAVSSMEQELSRYLAEVERHGAAPAS